MKEFFKRLYFSVKPSGRMVILDYPVEPKPVYSIQKPHQKLYDYISASRSDYAALLTASKKYFPALQKIKRTSDEANSIKPVWDNGYLPGLDIMMLYTILNEVKPAKYIEIGSGSSTKVAAKARRENNLTFTITSIDPQPRQEIQGLADEWIAEKLQDVSLHIFKTLLPNDVVFFDGTHCLLPASDVMHFFLEVLPVLPQGVIVQLHDIYLPYDYPPDMCKRFYSENSVLAAVLLAAPDKYKILCPASFISEDEALAQTIASFWQHPNVQGAEKHGGSFWFQVK